MKILPRLLSLLAAFSLLTTVNGASATEPPLKFGVGMFQPDRDKNDATYRPLADYLAAKLNRPVQLRTVNSWEP